MFEQTDFPFSTPSQRTGFTTVNAKNATVKGSSNAWGWLLAVVLLIGIGLLYWLSRNTNATVG